MNPNYPQGFYQQQYGYQPPAVPPPPDKVPGSARAIKITVGILVPLLWFIALALPAYNEKIYGIFCLFMGWSMIITGNIMAFFAWFSNLPFWIGFFLFVIGNGRKGKIAALILASASLMLSFGAFTVTQVVGDNGSLFDNSGLMTDAHVSYGTFVWMFSYLLIIIGSVSFISLNNTNRDSNLPPGIPPMPENPESNIPVDPYAQYPPQLPGEAPQNPWGE